MKLFIITTLLLFLISCKKEENKNVTISTDAIDGYADTVETGLNAISGATDDANNESVVAQVKPSLFERLIEQAFMSNAYAAICSRNLSGSNSGVCTRNVNCDYGPYLWSGTVQLSYSNGANCSLGSVGESYTRTVNFTRTGPRGSLLTTSNTRNTYSGSALGGGIVVTKADNAGAVDLEILGQHKILTRTNGSTVFDISLSTQTGSSLEMNQLARNGRTVSSGVIEVFHNRALYKAEHTISNLSYSSNCCYPTSGSISSTFSGSLTGTGSITFNSCGNFTATLNGQTKSYSMANCE